MRIDGYALFLGFWLLLVAPIVQAQIKLVEVEPFYYKNKKKATIAPFDYSKATGFAEAFPNFMSDGKYRLDPAYYRRHPRTEKYVHAEYDYISSAEEPAYFTESAVMLDSLTSVVVMLDYASSKALITKKLANPIYSPDDLAHAAAYGIPKDDVLRYAQFNNFFQAAARDVLRSKKAVKIQVAPIGSKDISGLGVAPRHLVLDLRMEKQQTGQALPSFMVYSLTVRDGTGRSYNTYKQAVFTQMSERENFMEFYLYGDEFFASTFRGALLSLLNQFLNDAPTREQVKAQLAAKNPTRKSAEAMQELYAAQVAYGNLLFQEEALRTRSVTLKASIEGFNTQLAADTKQVATGVRRPYMAYNSSVSPAMNAAANSTADALAAALINMGDKKEARQNEARVRDLRRAVENLQTKKQSLLATVQEIPASAEKDSFLQFLRNDNQLTTLVDATIASQAQSQTALHTKRKASSEAISKVGTQLNSQLAALTPAAETAAISSGGSAGGGAHAACQEQAQVEWARSAEYRNYKSNPTNANASDTKAKIIELTLQHCGDQLSAQEAATLRKTAADERALANQLRAGR